MMFEKTPGLERKMKRQEFRDGPASDLEEVKPFVKETRFHPAARVMQV
jgi:hypothetical protein